MVEQCFDKAKVAGSIPASGTKYWGYSSMVEQDAFNVEVAGSSPAAPTNASFDYRLGRHPFKVERWVRLPYGVPVLFRISSVVE